MDTTTTDAGGSIWSTLGDIINNGIITGTAQAVDNAVNPKPATTSAAASAAVSASSGSSTLMIAGLVVAALIWYALKK